MSKRNVHEWPHYGPHGDPDSKDPFVWAQARAPEGWHVEGQVIGGIWLATSLHDHRLVAYSPQELVAHMEQAGPVL